MTSVIRGIHGVPLCEGDLPDPTTKRWVPSRKATVVLAVQGGLISLEEACRRYNISVEEFLDWKKMIEGHGLVGLRTTQIQTYRAKRARH